MFENEKRERKKELKKRNRVCEAKIEPPTPLFSRQPQTSQLTNRQRMAVRKTGKILRHRM